MILWPNYPSISYFTISYLRTSLVNEIILIDYLSILFILMLQLQFESSNQIVIEEKGRNWTNLKILHLEAVKVMRSLNSALSVAYWKFLSTQWLVKKLMNVIELGRWQSMLCIRVYLKFWAFYIRFCFHRNQNEKNYI